MIVGVDPGETTGLFTLEKSGFRWYQETGWKPMEVLDTLHAREPIDVLVVEDFNVFDRRASLARKNITMPLRLIGAIAYFAHQREIELVMQWNTAKNRVPDDLLQSRGMMKRPKHVNRHANDAARHVLAFILKGTGSRT